MLLEMRLERVYSLKKEKAATSSSDFYLEQKDISKDYRC
jgi:hypothetical protein